MILKTLMLAVAISAQFPQSEVPSDSTRDALSCGQASCFLLLSQLGRETTLEELDADFSKPEAATLDDLSNALKRCGVPTTAWNVSWVRFREIQGPVICHLKNPREHIGHFQVAEWQGPELVILEPLSPHPVRLTLENAEQLYRNAFSGNVLIPNVSIPWHWRFSAGRWQWIGLVIAVLGGSIWNASRRSKRAVVTAE